MLEARNKSLRKALSVLVLFSFSVSLIMAATIILTERDAGRTIDIHDGDHLQVVLEANPSTGYVWEPASVDRNLLSQGAKEYIHAAHAFGAGGRAILHFRAIASGETWLRLVYHRPFEPDTSGQGRFDVLVKIK